MPRQTVQLYHVPWLPRSFQPLPHAQSHGPSYSLSELPSIWLVGSMGMGMEIRGTSTDEAAAVAAVGAHKDERMRTMVDKSSARSRNTD
mmetsp:Transcript_21736/g.47397  ORF Transcript_21736/g.47397 Transcript_21736/m.47397 type:complete len:89 (-) Transcript_21736:153-419(-)